MNKYQLDGPALTRLKAQANLTGIFNHSIRTAQNAALPFRLQVERNPVSATFTVEMGSQRHTLTLPNRKTTHRKLAAFIEEIANGSPDSGQHVV